jgi:lipoprotein-anchoring transpeptidase ErfK/SrfK
VRRTLVRIVVLGLVCAAIGGAGGPWPAGSVALQAKPAMFVPPIHRTELLARIGHRLPVTARPGAGRRVGWMPAASPGYRQPIFAWVFRRSASGRYGRVSVPFVSPHRRGWIDLRGLRLFRTGIRVDAILSRHLVVVRRRGRVLFRVRAATGAPGSPTPTGRYFVTDRVPFRRGSAYGTFAFGISGIQPLLPSGWSGGDQLAIHGTNQPWSIGKSVSAGCLRVSQRALKRLKPLLLLGTPVVISG